MIALHRDPHLDGSELRRIHLQFRAVQIVIDHPGHLVRHALPEFRRLYSRGDIQCRRRRRIDRRRGFALACAAPAALPPAVSTAETASAALRECLSAVPMLASTAAACALATAAGVTTAATSFGAASPAGSAALAARPPAGVAASSFADVDASAASAAPE